MRQVDMLACPFDSKQYLYLQEDIFIIAFIYHKLLPPTLFRGATSQMDIPACPFDS